jgi:hypothetical protein
MDQQWFILTRRVTGASAQRVWEMDRSIGWSTSSNAPAFSLVEPYDARSASVGNGSMTALGAVSNSGILHRSRCL